MRKIKVAIIYGGDSFEHDVSKMTTKSVLGNIDREEFDVLEFYIPKSGKFKIDELKKVDVVFLAVHGPNCEDGKLQKLLEDNGIKYTGSGIEASRLNMNKTEMHKSFQKNGINTVKFFGVSKKDKTKEINNNILTSFGYPCFVKPDNTGSSVGINKVTKEAELQEALNDAFQYDNKIIIEQAIKDPKEIEMGVLGNDDLIISEPGEVLSHGKVYSYDTKYLHPFETSLYTKLNLKKINELKLLAGKAFECTGCQGYARVDFLLDEKENIFINEINTLPGFTSISMFPKLMQKSGISYKNLVTKIIQLALE